MALVKKRRDDTEVTATTTQGPEEIRIFVGAGNHHRAVGEHHVGFEKVVDGETVAASEVAETTSEGEATDTGGGDDPARDGQPVSMGGVIHVAPSATRLHPDGLGLRVDPDSPHRGQIDHQTAIHRTETPRVVAAAANRQGDAVVAGVIDTGLHIGGVHALCNHRRFLVDHRVVDGAGFVVLGVLSFNDLAPKHFVQIGIFGLFNHGSPPFAFVLFRKISSGRSPVRKPYVDF